MKFNSLPFLMLLLLIAVISCKKEDILTDSSAKLEFSDDTVMFDTVFASLGSTTRQLKIYNRNNRPLKISSIILAGGSASTYRLNLDGVPGKNFYNIEIPGDDSLYIFVEVTVNPADQATPYIIQDSILFETNGNLQDVDLVAFGQKARFIVADQVLGVSGGYLKYALLDTAENAIITWTKDTPYVVWGGYAVVDETQKLIIEPGTKIYFANNCGLWIYKGGTLEVNGNQSEPVLFQGIRRESYYQDIPGQWDRIWINEGSANNIINYAEIRNSFIGIQAESLLDTVGPKNLEVNNTIIYNASGFGMFTRYYNVQVRNTVISRCGQYAVALTRGGGYEFTHCTIANYWNNSQRSTPSVYMNDYGVDDAENFVEFPLSKADFNNCIIWGNNEEELEIDYQFNSNSHHFNNVLLRSEIDTTPSNFTNILLNMDPLFVNPAEDDYQLQSASPAKDYGDVNFVNGSILINDIRGINRTATPDLGAYEVE